MNSVADTIGLSSPVIQAERSDFNLITRGINPGMNGADARWYVYAGNKIENIIGTTERFFSIGGNPYDAMAEVLEKIGVKSSNASEYSDKFGLTFKSKELVAIGQRSNLIAQTLLDEIDGGKYQDDDIEAHKFFEYAREALSLSEKDVIMWAVDPPTSVVDPTPVVVIAQSSGQKSIVDVTKLIARVGYCETINESNRIAPSNLAEQYLYDFHGIDMRKLGGDVNAIILTAPKHGDIVKHENYGWWEYRSTEAKEGKYELIEDSFVIRVAFSQGATVDVHYLMFVMAPDESLVEFCTRTFWKISQTPETADPNHLITWQTQSSLSALLAAASGVHTELADLPGAALGLHEGGSGWNARITLDDNAAGHGWYVDATPWSVNDDYLPTSDPNLWLAKPGSGAEGKMDLLSVWLHELGHAAGLDHTASGAGLMGATLLPGQRRLPTQPELLQMFSHLHASGLVPPEAQAAHSAALAGRSIVSWADAGSPTPGAVRIGGFGVRAWDSGSVGLYSPSYASWPRATS